MSSHTTSLTRWIRYTTTISHQPTQRCFSNKVPEHHNIPMNGDFQLVVSVRVYCTSEQLWWETSGITSSPVAFQTYFILDSCCCTILGLVYVSCLVSVCVVWGMLLVGFPRLGSVLWRVLKPPNSQLSLTELLINRESSQLECIEWVGVFGP